MGWTANIALWRLGDKTLLKNHLWGLPETHLLNNSKTTSSITPARKLLVQTTDHLPLVGLKTIQSFRFVLDNYDFDYIFRTNTSSYVDGPQLVRFTKQLSPGDIYAGFQGLAPTGPFASGAGMLLSRSLLERVLAKASRWRHGLNEDVALSILIKEELESDIKITPLKRLQFESVEQVSRARDDEIKETFHFRCKTKSANETVQIMREIFIRKSNLK